MEKKRVYLETTIVSYLTARPSRDLIVAAHQELTREWWETRRKGYELYMSQFVAEEASKGDPEAVFRRLRALDGLRVLPATQEVRELAEAFVAKGLIPASHDVDASHLAIAVCHRIDVLLTWNCTHLANGDTLGAIGSLVRRAGYEMPTVCTPIELMGKEGRDNVP